MVAQPIWCARSRPVPSTETTAGSLLVNVTTAAEPLGTTALSW